MSDWRKISKIKREYNFGATNAGWKYVENYRITKTSQSALLTTCVDTVPSIAPIFECCPLPP